MRQGLLRRLRRWFGGFDYRKAYSRVDLERDHWSIVGPASREEFEALGRGKRQLLLDLGLTPQSRLLDVGCGTGQLTAALLDFLQPPGWYCGTDIAPEAVAFCRRKYRRENFIFAQGEMTRLGIKQTGFDFIYFGSVLTHLYPAEMAALLADARPRLAPSGMIVADAFVAGDIEDYRGDRGMVVVSEPALLATFAELGLHCRTLRRWDWEPGVKRAIYQLTATQ